MNRKLFSAPLTLSKAETADYYEIEGIASTEDRDLQDEILEQNGFDLSELGVGKIVFNDDHSAKTQDIIGLVDEARITKKGLQVKGKLFKNNPAAMTYYNLMKHGGYVGFSVEGSVKERDSFDKSKIKQARITAIALTRNPVNQNTYAKFAKSLSEHNETFFEALEPSLESKIDKLTDMLERFEKGGPGSGKKPGGGKGPTPSTHTAEDRAPKAVAPKVKEGVQHRQEDKERINSTQAASDKEVGDKRRDRSLERREEMKQEIKAAYGRYKGPELKEAIKVIKRKFFGAHTRKIKMEKSQFQELLVERAKKDPEFAKALQSRLHILKALSSGGAAYADSIISDFSGGQVFQTEDIDKKKKKLHDVATKQESK